eukprot:6339470-Prymnesium_polylepis.1
MWVSKLGPRVCVGGWVWGAGVARLARLGWRQSCNRQKHKSSTRPTPAPRMQGVARRVALLRPVWQGLEAQVRRWVWGSTGATQKEWRDLRDCRTRDRANINMAAEAKAAAAAHDRSTKAKPHK